MKLLKQNESEGPSPHRETAFEDQVAEQSKSIVVYDGGCRFCCRQVERIRRRDTRAQFEYVPRQQPELIERIPALADADFNTGMRLVTLDGTIHVGADAVYQIARHLPRWRWIVWVYRMPVIHVLARLVYAWIAANRLWLSRTCDEGACKLSPGDTPRR